MASTSEDTYKYKFVSEPDDAHKCPICLDVAEEPWQHGKCGRLFCKKCLDEFGTDKPCSHCRMEQPQYFEDNKSKREINNLRVKCDNFERKCQWKGTVEELEEHLATCEFALLPCPNECIDNEMNIKCLIRKTLDFHIKWVCPKRDCKCTNGRRRDICKEKGTHYYIKQVHDKVCLNKMITCTKCFKPITRQSLPRHVESKCEHTVIACKYKSIGCETELKRKDMPAHEDDDKLHLHMAINTIIMMKEKEMKHEEPITIRYTDYQVRKGSKIHLNSPSFYTSQGYHMSLRVDANGCGDYEGTHVSVFVCPMEGKHDDHLHWPLVGSVTLTLLNQLDDKNHYTKVLSLTTTGNIIVGKSWGYSKFIPHSELGHDPIKNTQYLKDDTLYFRVLLNVKDDKPWLHCSASNIM